MTKPDAKTEGGCSLKTDSGASFPRTSSDSSMNVDRSKACRKRGCDHGLQKGNKVETLAKRREESIFNLKN